MGRSSRTRIALLVFALVRAEPESDEHAVPLAVSPHGQQARQVSAPANLQPLAARPEQPVPAVKVPARRVRPAAVPTAPIASDAPLGKVGPAADARADHVTVQNTSHGEATDDHGSAVDDPLARDYPLHGLAVHMQAQVFAEPSEHGAVIGYFRRGGRLRATPAMRGKGCDARWHAVFGGGFICAGRGFLLAETEPEFSPLPAAPALDQPLPYTYTKLSAADTPLYSRAPTLDEERMLSSWLLSAKQSERRASLVKPSAQAHRRAAKQQDDKPAQSQTPPLPEFVRMLMQPGYYVSVDTREVEAERSWLRTVRGDLLQLQRQTPVTVSPLHGVELAADAPGPWALVQRARATSFTRDADSGLLRRGQPLHLLQAFALRDELAVHHGRQYRVTREGLLVAADALRVVPHTPRPAFVPKTARYVAIQLSTQTLVAYDGDTPVFATLVSTGKAEQKTPTGIFRIQQKHISTTMNGEAGTDEAYSIEDVPWTMYFSGSLGLHAAFWHERFGQPRSHGCVNLAPRDARWLFEWTGPRLPQGFHGVSATRDNPGTFVVITP